MSFFRCVVVDVRVCALSFQVLRQYLIHLVLCHTSHNLLFVSVSYHLKIIIHTHHTYQTPIEWSHAYRFEWNKYGNASFLVLTVDSCNLSKPFNWMPHKWMFKVMLLIRDFWFRDLFNRTAAAFHAVWNASLNKEPLTSSDLSRRTNSSPHS